MTENLKLGIHRVAPDLVRVQIKPGYEVSEPGVVCINPDADQKDLVYRKDFCQKPIYLPGEYDTAMNNHVRTESGVVISMNGYSSLTREWLARYGIKPGAYEAACAALLTNTINHIRKKFQAVQIRIIHGASHMGIDGAVDKVAKSEFGITPLGFSCPEFMIFVDDDETPVYVAKDKSDYADAYIRSLDLLITTGGRMHALEHDTLAACVYNKRIHFVDVPNMLSTVTVPARIVRPGGKIEIENAAAAFGHNISFADCQKVRSQAPTDGDQWDALFASVGGIATDVVRHLLPPELMFKTQ